MAVILIVEDDVFIGEIAEMMIQDWGHRTLSASDVDEALSLLRFPSTHRCTFYRNLSQTAVLGGCGLAGQAIALRPQSGLLYTTGNSTTDKMNALFVEGSHVLVSHARNISSKTLLKTCWQRNCEKSSSLSAKWNEQN